MIIEMDNLIIYISVSLLFFENKSLLCFVVCVVLSILLSSLEPNRRSSYTFIFSSVVHLEVSQFAEVASVLW